MALGLLCLAGCTVAEGQPDSSSEDIVEVSEISDVEATSEVEADSKGEATAEQVTLEETTEATETIVADDSWKGAYATYLRSDDWFDEWKEGLGGFRLYDMDSNGIPELFVEYWDGGGRAYADVFTYDKEMVNVGNLYGGAGVGIEVSENPMYQGVFHQTYGYGTEHFSVYYSELKGNKLETIHVSISEYVENKGDFVVSEMHNQRLYDEWKNLKYTAFYEGTEANIKKYIYGQDSVSNTSFLASLPTV